MAWDYQKAIRLSCHTRCGHTCPVTIVCGEKDSANLKASKKLNELLPHATLQIVPGAGHEINKDAPEAIAAVLNM